MSKLSYDKDFYGWAKEQANLLRTGFLDANAIELKNIDWKNIAEELDGLSRSEKRELINRLTILLLHLLKWQHQSQRRSHSWQYTIEEQRLRLHEHLADNPSLNAQLDDAIERAYKLAVVKACKQTHLPKPIFAINCPYGWEQIIDHDFYPN
jgi:hypothetical protein